MIARAHVRSLFDLPKMQNDNDKDLRKLIESIGERRLSLQTLGLPVEHYGLSHFPCNGTIRLRNSTTMGNCFTWYKLTNI